MNVPLGFFQDLLKALPTSLAAQIIITAFAGLLGLLGWLWRKSRGVLRKGARWPQLGFSWPPADIAMVGRAREMELLDSSWTRVQGGSAQAVFVSGEAGIGKTKLAQEFLSRQDRKAMRWLAASSAFRGDQNTPYLALIGALRPITEKGFIPDVPDEILAQMVAFIPELAGKYPGLPAAPKADPDQARINNRAAWQACLLSLAQDLPLVLYLDDLQWVDASTLSCLQELLVKNPHKRILFIGGLRVEDQQLPEHIIEFRADLRRRQLFTEIALDPLSQQETAMLVQEKLGATATRVAQALYERTAGNPFFIVEMSELLRDRGVVRAGGEALRPEQIPIPEGVADLIHLRLQDVGDPGRQLLNSAAVVGRDFSLDFLQKVSTLPSGQVSAAMDQLARRRLLRQSNRLWDFSSGIVRDVIYQDPAFWQRGELHQRAGIAMEETAGQSPTVSQLQQMAGHFHEGGVWDKDWGYSLRAGLATLDLYDTRAARRYLETAEQVAESELHGQIAEKQRFDYLDGLGRVYSSLGEYEKAVAYYQKALSLVEADAEASADLCWKIAVVHRQSAEFDQAISWLDRGLKTVKEGSALRARLAMQYALIRYIQGNWVEALQWAEAASAAQSAQLCNLMAILYRAQGRLSEAQARVEQGIRLAETNQDRLNLAKAYTNQAVILFDMERWEESKRANEQALHLHDEIGDAYMHAMTLCNLSDVRRHLGDLEAALALAADGLQEYEAQGSEYGLALAHLNLGAALLEKGSVKESREHLECAKELSIRCGAQEHLPEIKRRLAEARLAEGAFSEAAAAAQDALQEATLEAGALTETAEGTGNAFQKGPRRAAQAHLASAWRVLGRVRQAQGNPAEAEKAFRESLAALNQQELNYELGCTQLALAEFYAAQPGRSSEAQEHLERASAIFQKLGAKLALAQTAAMQSTLQGRAGAD